MEHDIELSVSLHSRGAANGRLIASTAQGREAIRSAPYRLAGKRAFDVVVSAVALFALLGVFAVIALAIKLDSPGPVFFRVRRTGYRGRPLLMLKFRKMHDDARGGPLTVAGDPRLTRVGRVLTRTRLDELPQLWDVFRGRMSIIGPRPEDPGFVDLHAEEYSHILRVRPGITGLSQIAYKAESAIVDPRSPVEDYIERILPQKLTLDQLYARACTLTLDIRIVYWTFVTVILHHPVSVNRATAAMTIRRRPQPRPALESSVAPSPAALKSPEMSGLTPPPGPVTPPAPVTPPDAVPTVFATGNRGNETGIPPRADA